MTLSRLPRLTALALLAGPTGPAGAQAPPSEVRLETSDGVTVFGDVYRTSVASELRDGLLPMSAHALGLQTRWEGSGAWPDAM